MQVSYRSSRFFWIFPVVSATAWFTTLVLLLAKWLIEGRPQYPGQINPDVAFISDIGAHDFRPVFITGNIVTAISFNATAISVHWARYSPSFHGFTADQRGRRILSTVATVLAVVASVSLVALSVFDTERYHRVHISLLLVTFAGLAGNAVATSVVWWREGEGVWIGKPREKQSDFESRLQFWVFASNLLVLVDIAVLIALVACMYVGRMRIAGILEWVQTFVGCGYLFAFTGYLRAPQKLNPRSIDDHSDDERRPLLQS